MLKVTVLGCGASSGVPLIGCKCAVCTSANPKNKRTRVSVYIETEGKKILIDTSPDMRAQFLAHDLNKVDAIIYTHDHADHLHGLDDVRSFNFYNDASIDTYIDETTLTMLRKRFDYVFLEPKPAEYGWYRPSLNPIAIKAYSPFSIGKVQVLPFEQAHGKGTTLGLRFGGFAYSTDTNGLSEEAFKALEGIDTWIVDCLRYEPAPTHAHLEMTLEWIKRVKPKRAYLTHLNHGFDYDKLLSELPENVFPAHDGLILEI